MCGTPYWWMAEILYGATAPCFARSRRQDSQLSESTHFDLERIATREDFLKSALRLAELIVHFIASARTSCSFHLTSGGQQRHGKSVVDTLLACRGGEHFVKDSHGARKHRELIAGTFLLDAIPSF